MRSESNSLPTNDSKSLRKLHHSGIREALEDVKAGPRVALDLIEQSA